MERHEGFEAVTVRQSEIEQRDLEATGGEALQPGRQPIRAFAREGPRLRTLQLAFDEPRIGRVVFDEQDADHRLVPALSTWWQQPTALRLAPVAIPATLRWVLVVMAAGVLVSGARDLYAATRWPSGGWPWTTGRAM